MHTEASSSYRRDLGQGLVARWSTADDSENIAQLVAMVFRSKADEPVNTHLTNKVRRLMRGDNPLMDPGDYAIVEDTSKEGHPIVACICHWRHTWEYEGIAFEVGRPEIVATHPDYRNRGLIRVLFEMVHARSADEGRLITAITGIPYFYRQFGYEYALDLGSKRTTYISQIPRAKEGEQEPYTFHEATIEDIPLIQKFYNRRSSNSIVWNKISDAYWRYELEGWKVQPEWGKTSTILMIVDNEGEAKGYLQLAPKRWGRELDVWGFDVAPGANMQSMLPSVLRALRVYGDQVPTTKPDADPFSEIGFYLGHNSPLYERMGGLALATAVPYAWYVRVPDLPSFLKHIAPALEKRLANSDAAGYTGELKLDFYHGGLRMVFEQGQLTTVENWVVPVFESNAGAGFPALVFLQVVFGHRSLDELRHAFPDVWASDETGYLLKILFPARPSFVLP
ncbi:MAG: GNAT family N-acetyltransferase [Ktedonobacteraceae bacterium]|nr:GNAT family N-acetyltransferase [Ktedonobacteraceae bacterium]